jgi:radical SAM protein with 4Fe4S-binding SPASM domain
MSNTAQLPLSLRPEQFGGILFDPADGAFVEVDTEGYRALEDLARTGSRPNNKEVQAFLAEIDETVGSLDSRAFRIVPDTDPLPHTSVPILSGPTLVDFQITDKCHLDCPHCYASSTSAGKHGDIDGIMMALDQIAEVGAFQVAIGGGEPLLHPDLASILKRCHALGLVPNLTTSGLNLTPRMLDALARYCGAVGVSLEGVGEDFDDYRKTGFKRFETTVEKLRDHEVPVVLQVTLNVQTIDRLPQITEYCLSQPDLYGVIFLAFKPVGRGAIFGETLGKLPHRKVHDALQTAFHALTAQTRVGFDCCLTPGVTGIDAGYDSHAAAYLEGCSALRTSIGLSPTLDVMPCTFTGQYAVGNLHDRHLKDIWRGLMAQDFRDNMKAKAMVNTSCSTCAKYSYCLGGCPVMDLVNCGNDYLGASGATRKRSSPPAPAFSGPTSGGW